MTASDALQAVRECAADLQFARGFPSARDGRFLAYLRGYPAVREAAEVLSVEELGDAVVEGFRVGQEQREEECQP